MMAVYIKSKREVIKLEKNIKTIDLENGYSLKSYNYIDADNKHYYIVELYKDGEIQFFDEKRIEV